MRTTHHFTFSGTECQEMSDEAKDLLQTFEPDSTTLFRGHNISKMVRYLDAIIDEVKQAPTVYGPGAWTKEEGRINTHGAKLIMVKPLAKTLCEIHIPIKTDYPWYCRNCGAQIEPENWELKR